MTAREAMVAHQIAARGISDPAVLAAMRAVPRHRFVEPSRQAEAYADRALPIAEGQTISQPYMVALMTAALDVRPAHRVLEIGTGSGYQAAVLAHLAAAVVSIERHAALAEAAIRLLREMGLRNVEVVVGDGTEGWAPGSPYDRIIVTAGAPAVPAALTDQLVDGGRLVMPVGPLGLQHLTVVDRQRGVVTSRTGESCVFVPLVGQYGWPEDG